MEHRRGIRQYAIKCAEALDAAMRRDEREFIRGLMDDLGILPGKEQPAEGSNKVEEVK